MIENIISVTLLLAVAVYIFWVVIHIYGIKGEDNACIDSMQNVPVSDKLEEAAKHYLYSNILYDDVYVGNPTEKDCIEMFKAGVKWKEQQMMARRKYKEALERAKYYLKENGSAVITAIFPELKESEDEKIRKDLIDFLEYYRLNNELDSKTISLLTNSVVWLEKQGEQKSIWHNEDEEPKRGSLILLIMQSGTPIVAKIIEPNHTFNHGERWAYIDDLLEKQGEQKPKGEIEPKFKVGDTIKPKDGGHEPWQIMQVDILDKKYRFNDGYVIHFSQEDDYELVEQKPAEISNICEFSIKTWVKIVDYVLTEHNGIGNYLIDPEVKDTAEKLQKKYKFDAASEEWDRVYRKGLDAGVNKGRAEALREQKFAEWHREDEQNLNACLGYIPDEFLRRWLMDAIHVKYDKNAWSEEDESHIRYLIECLEHYKKGVALTMTTYTAQEYISWLKSLRPQSNWKPSDNELEVLRLAAEKDGACLMGLYKELKKLREE